MRSVVVGGQRTADRLPRLEVVPDRGRERQHPLGHPHTHTLDRATTVLFQVKLALESVIHRLDELADLLEHRLARPHDLPLTGGPQQGDALFGQ